MVDWSSSDFMRNGGGRYYTVDDTQGIPLFEKPENKQKIVNQFPENKISVVTPIREGFSSDVNTDGTITINKDTLIIVCVLFIFLILLILVYRSVNELTHVLRDFITITNISNK